MTQKNDRNADHVSRQAQMFDQQLVCREREMHWVVTHTSSSLRCISANFPIFED